MSKTISVISEMIAQLPPPRQDEVRDFVEFLLNKENAAAGSINLAEHGIDETKAASLRARLKTFAEDWERPEMEAYDAL